MTRRLHSLAVPVRTALTVAVLGALLIDIDARAARGLPIDVEARVGALLARMTLDEKLGQPSR
jgi:hypothetical protein